MFVEYAVQCIRGLTKDISKVEIINIYNIVVFIMVFGLVKLIYWARNLRRLPPGPWGFPILGYLPFIKGDLHLQFGRLAAKYGSMFSAKLGSQLIIVLSDYRTIRETFRREDFSGRPHTEFMNILGGYGKLFILIILLLILYIYNYNLIMFICIL